MSEQPTPYNASDPQQVGTRKRREDREKLRNEDSVKFVMGHPLGRHFVWRLLADAGLYRQPFAGNSSTDFYCGRLDVGLKLIAKLETETPKEFLSMWSEHLAEKEKNGKEETNG